MILEKERTEPLSLRMEELVLLALDIGEQVLICGGEISRVEDTISRVCQAYGAVRTDVFAITSLIVMTVIGPSGEVMTQSRRIYGCGKNMRRLEKINALSRRICSESLPLVQARSTLNVILKEKQKTGWRIFAGSLLAAVSFTAFFGGNLRDCFAGLVVASAIAATQLGIAKVSVNRILSNLFCSFVAGAIAILSVAIGLGSSVDWIMTGCIMLLIPGVAMTNAVENLMLGDTLSGLLGFFESIIVALSLAAGFALSWFFIGGLL